MIIRIFKNTKKHKFGLMILAYYMLLVLLTDCFLWYQLESVKGHSIEKLILYSFLASPLWIIWTRKGPTVEMGDFIVSGRQFHIEILPISYNFLYYVSFLGKTLKMPAFWIWFILYSAVMIFFHIDFLNIFLGLFLLILGFSINLLLINLLTVLSPRNYLGVLSAIFSNITWLLSGTVIPLSFISKSLLFYYLNPFASTIYGPLSFILEPSTGGSLRISYHLFISNIIWISLLLLITPYIEKRRRAAIN